ncbi:MAG: 8-oxo-dGTP diphosphatase [Clostridia bacterium]|nr:8-oxo-dGTP diphosphatase [Clostridia bacterium]
MPGVELTNMIMIRHPETGKVVVQDRVKSWKGYSFPGGHLENGESIVASTVREAYEETGLKVRDLEFCGMIHWSNNETFERYLVFLFRTESFEGELITETEEGKNCWMDLDVLRELPSDNDFPKYIPMFTENRYSEAFGDWNDKEPWDIVYL